jgi:hypothetical protein
VGTPSVAGAGAQDIIVEPGRVVEALRMLGAG